MSIFCKKNIQKCFYYFILWSTLCVYIFFLIPWVEAASRKWNWKIYIPWESSPEVNTQTDVISWADAENTIVRLLKTFNEGLWIAIIVSAFAILIYAWYLLITSTWKEESLTKANKTLLFLWAWIVLALLAYGIIRLISNLF